MKTVYINTNNTVIEIIPHEATIPSVAHWYNEEFASHCVEAPDDVAQRWVYDPDTKTFSPPPDPEQLTPAEQRKQAYETEPIINWGGQLITVDEANKLWTDYAAEDSAKAELLTGLIKEAKAAIREKYSD